MKPRYVELLSIWDALAPSTKLPVPVVAAHEGVSEKTVRRIYQLHRVSDGRGAVLKSDIGHPRVRRRGRPRKRVVTS
jgi:hypothetical protein